MIQSALTYVIDQEEITVRLHPSDLAFVSQRKGEMIGGIKKVFFEGDEGISRGDAVIESSRGVIDCGIEKHLQEVEENLRAQAREDPRREGKEKGKEKEDEDTLKESSEDHDN